MIQVSDTDTFPEEAFKMMLDRFNEMKMEGNYPPIGAVNTDDGDMFPIGSITSIGRLASGEIVVGMALDINMNIKEDTGEIVGLLLKSSDIAGGDQ